MIKLFITGSNGWLGRNLIEYIIKRKADFNIDSADNYHYFFKENLCRSF
jgi:nucleoside-diphosphate-sugar epimerase